MAVVCIRMMISSRTFRGRTNFYWFSRWHGEIRKKRKRGVPIFSMSSSFSQKLTGLKHHEGRTNASLSTRRN
jgi:hypothetical protein